MSKSLIHIKKLATAGLIENQLGTRRATRSGATGGTGSPFLSGPRRPANPATATPGGVVRAPSCLPLCVTPYGEPGTWPTGAGVRT